MPEETDPDKVPPGSDVADTEEPSDLRARRFEAGAPSVPVANPGGDAPVPGPAAPEPGLVMPPGPATPAPYDRPRVSIDQIDVVIHEDANPGGSRGGSSTPDFGRAFRARYLGGL